MLLLDAILGLQGNVCHCGDNKCEVQIPPCKDGCAAAGVGLTECKGECVVSISGQKLWTAGHRFKPQDAQEALHDSVLTVY
jgi:hypothetical protein